MGTYEITTESGTYQVDTEDSGVSAPLPDQAVEAPSWGDSAKFVGKSFAQGVGKTADLAAMVAPSIFGGSPTQPNKYESLMTDLFGKPSEVEGPAARIVDSTMQATAFPGGPVGNALSGAGAGVARELFPESDIAPIIGALAPSTVGAGIKALGNKAVSAGKALERASLGTQTRDYLKSLNTKGIIDDVDVKEYTTRIGQSIDEIGKSEGWGLFRDPQRLVERNKQALAEAGDEIGAALKVADEAMVNPKVDILNPNSATQKFIKSQTTQKPELKQALGEFVEKFSDPVDGWDGTVSQLNKWKSEAQNIGFSGTATGALPPALARKLQRALGEDLKESVTDAVLKAGVDPEDWAAVLRRYSNHKEVQPILQRGLASELSSTWDKTTKALLRTSGGTLTTPAVIGALLAGTGGGAGVGLAAGATLAALGSPTGQGVVGSVLKGAGKLASKASIRPESAISGMLATGSDPKSAMEDLFSKEPTMSKDLEAPQVISAKKIKIEPVPIKQGIKHDDLYKAVIKQESGGKANAVSDVGAIGLMQVMPETAKEIAKALGVEKYDLKDPETNMKFGKYYLNKLLDKYDGDAELALTAYHSGPGRVDKLLAKNDATTLDEIIDDLGPVGQKYAKQVLGRIKV